MPSLQAVSARDVIDRLGPELNGLLQIATDADPSTNPRFVAALESANATIYSFIRTRYAMPRETNDPALSLYGCNLVQYDLASRNAGIFTEAHKTLRMDAVKFLEGVRDGKNQLSYPPENRNEAAAPGVLAAVGGDVSATDYPDARNQAWFAKW